VAELGSFKCKEGQQSSKVQLQRVKEVFLDKDAGYIFPLKPMYEKLRRTIALGEDTSGMLLPDPELTEVQVISDQAEGNPERKVENCEPGVHGDQQAEGDLDAGSRCSRECFGEEIE